MIWAYGKNIELTLDQEYEIIFVITDIYTHPGLKGLTLGSNVTLVRRILDGVYGYINYSLLRQLAFNETGFTY